YVIGLAAAFLTAIYMTRMMLYTFHGPNRTGEAERHHLADAPWVMTGPLLVLGLLSALGGWINLPQFLPLGPVGALEHWLHPVVGESARRITNGVEPEMASSTEWLLVGIAVAVAVAGILVARSKLKPETLPTKTQATPEQGFERVLANKYFVD